MLRSVAALLILAWVASGQAVKLTALAQPSTAYAGVTVVSVTGSGFSVGITASSLTVDLAATCNGAAVETVAVSEIANVVGSTKRISFTPPANTPAGTYAVSIAGAGISTNSCAALTVDAEQSFVRTSRNSFTLNGMPFRFGGANAWAIAYADPVTADQVIATAKANDFRVLRVSGWEDIGQANGTGSLRGPNNGVYFQYWNGSAPAYNDGATGLQHLDYAIYSASKAGVKLILNFTNNWTDFGGMDQYVEWAGLSYHDQFYTDPTIRQWYKNWIHHLLNRVNTYTGVVYKNDPTIMMWELANEPRCTGSGPSGNGYNSSGSCTTATITSWISDVSSYVKSMDSNHLLAVGDEGFFCEPSSSSWIDNCSQGVDTVAFTSIPSIDAMGYHLYPEGWGQTDAWATSFIAQHITDAYNIGKPSYLGEYGLLSADTRNAVYKMWTDQVLTSTGATGALFWDLNSGVPGPNSAEADNSFDVEQGAPLLNTLKNFSEEIAANTQLPFGPVADDQWATVNYNQPAMLTPLQNDIAYGGATVEANSIDLDPATPGLQTAVTVYGGQFMVSGSTVQFTPAPGFNGVSQAPYTVEDSNHALSNIAYLTVTVKPSEGAVLNLESFETGTDNWGPINPGDGTVSWSTTFHTDGTHGLEASTAKTSWFGVAFASPVDLSNRPSLSIDVETTGLGGGSGFAIQSGSGYAWCQSASFTTLPTNGVTTLTVPLDASQMQCYGTPDFSDVEAIWIYLPGGGTFYFDYLRAAAAATVNTPVEIESFETGTDGWHSNHSTGGTVSQTSAFHTDGNFGLQVNSTGGDWFGFSPASLPNLTGKTKLLYDLQTGSAGTSLNFAIQSGASWNWCQGNSWGWENSNESGTISFDLTNMSCAPDLSQIHALWIWFSTGTFDIDNVRAE